jgi:penicillin-binding protein 2
MFGSQFDDNDEQRLKFTRRALLIGCGQAVAFGGLATKLYQLQVMEAARYAPLAEENRMNVQLVAPLRGRILDRYGVVLAANEEGFRATLIPSLAGNVPRVLERLSRIIPISAEEQEKLAARARRQQPNIPLIVANELSFEQIASVNLLAPQLPGVQVEVSAQRKYLGGDTMGHVVGHVGSVERVSIDDDPLLRLPGLRVGRTGVERGMDERLRGQAGTIRHEIDVRGRIVRTLSETEAVRGDDIALTIDSPLQRAVSARLSRERRASAVAIDTNTGDVVMMVSVPTHDPGDLVRGVTARTWEKLKETGNDPMVNRAIRGLYPPGSTFKMVTALAALEAGVIDLTAKITCEGQAELAGQVFRCWKRSGHGACDFHRALRESCDCYFYEIAHRTGIDAIAAMGRRLGLGQTFDMGLAHQKAGVMPDSAWKRGRFNRAWLGGETLLAGIGQGYVLATPLQLAVMTARLATGRAIVPQLVRPEAGMVPATFGNLGLAPKLLDAVRRGMTAVVNEEGGTGSRTQLDDGQPLVAGKTGTSQVSRASSERNGGELKWEQRDHALFVAYVPANAPRYAISVVVEHGGGGGATAGPVMRDIITEILARDPARRPSYPDLTGADAVSQGKEG